METKYGMFTCDNRAGVSCSIQVLRKEQYVLVRDDGRHALMKYVYEDGYYQYHADDMMKGRIKQFIADYDETLVNLRDVNAALEHIKTDLDYAPMDLMDLQQH